MNNPNDKMTKLQANVIKRRKDEWSESVILEHLQKKFNDPTITNLQKLTKLQAQTVIVDFKPHNPANKKGEK